METNFDVDAKHLAAIGHFITKSFPHRFTKTYTRYADNEVACHIDAHMLIALAAPRPIYIASAVEDT